MSHPFFDSALPLVFGHRGASGELPENTMASFRLALEQGADVFETDIHRTRDGKIVAAHDDSLVRMTNGRGLLAQHTWQQLRELDAGYGFTRGDPDDFPERGRGHRIPLLSELFEEFPEVRFNIELKQSDPELARGLVEMVQGAKREALTLVTAQEDSAMAMLRAASQRAGLRAAMGACKGDVVSFIRAAQADAAPPPELMALQVPPLFDGQPLVTPPFLEHAHRHAVSVHVWTINEAEDMRALLELGVDGVMSDYPARLRALVDARA